MKDTILSLVYLNLLVLVLSTLAFLTDYISLYEIFYNVGYLNMFIALFQGIKMYIDYKVENFKL